MSFKFPLPYKVRSALLISCCVSTVVLGFSRFCSAYYIIEHDGLRVWATPGSTYLITSITYNNCTGRFVDVTRIDDPPPGSVDYYTAYTSKEYDDETGEFIRIAARWALYHVSSSFIFISAGDCDPCADTSINGIYLSCPPPENTQLGINPENCANPCCDKPGQTPDPSFLGD